MGGRESFPESRIVGRTERDLNQNPGYRRENRGKRGNLGESQKKNHKVSETKNG